MPTVSSLILLLALAGCSGTPQRQGASPCAADAGGRACEVERYMKAP